MIVQRGTFRVLKLLASRFSGWMTAAEYVEQVLVLEWKHRLREKNVILWWACSVVAHLCFVSFGLNVWITAWIFHAQVQLQIHFSQHRRRTYFGKRHTLQAVRCMSWFGSFRCVDRSGLLGWMRFFACLRWLKGTIIALAHFQCNIWSSIVPQCLILICIQSSQHLAK